jgi:non-ribosomal peptide synthetase component F
VVYKTLPRGCLQFIDYKIIYLKALFERSLMTLMAGYGILLHRLTGNDELVIGIPTGGRSVKGGERVIGNLRHLLPVRVRLIDNPTFSEYLAKLKPVLLNAYEHQDYSFANAFNKLLVQGEPNSPPLMATTFNLDRFVMPKLFQLVVEDFFALPISFMPFDLSLNIIEADDELVCDFEYNVELFEANTIQGWLASFQILLETIVANPSEQVTNLLVSSD